MGSPKRSSCDKLGEVGSGRLFIRTNLLGVLLTSELVVMEVVVGLLSSFVVVCVPKFDVLAVSSIGVSADSVCVDFSLDGLTTLLLFLVGLSWRRNVLSKSSVRDWMARILSRDCVKDVS